MLSPAARSDRIKTPLFEGKQLLDGHAAALQAGLDFKRNVGQRPQFIQGSS